MNTPVPDPFDEIMRQIDEAVKAIVEMPEPKPVIWQRDTGDEHQPRRAAQ